MDIIGACERSDQAMRAGVVSTTPASAAQVEIADRVRAYVQAHLGRSIAVAEIVAMLGVSESTARRAVSAVAGQHLAQFVTGIRLDRVHLWLSSNRETRTQAQIAAALGFRSARAFARAYRKRFGRSLADTRRAAAQNQPH